MVLCLVNAQGTKGRREGRKGGQAKLWDRGCSIFRASPSDACTLVDHHEHSKILFYHVRELKEVSLSFRKLLIITSYIY